MPDFLMARSKYLTNLVLDVCLVGILLTLSIWPTLDARAASGLVQSRPKHEKPASLVAQGVTALEGNDPTAAKAFFERALAIDRHDGDAHTYLGVLADRAGDLPEAERHFAAAAAAAPLSAEARNNHGGILLRMGRIKQADAQFEASLRLNKNQPSALVNLAQIRFKSGSPQGVQHARELFERAWAIAPDLEIMRSLVITALRLDDRPAAAVYFRRYSELPGSPSSPGLDPSARAELGTALLAAGLNSEAIEELSAAAAAEPNNAQFIELLARAYLARKDISAAGRVLEAAVARGIEAAPIFATLAEVYEQSGHVENAIPAMRLAIQQDSRNEEYRFRYGMLLTDTNVPAAAVIRLKEALEIFPGSPKLWFALGIAHFTEHKSDEATRAFQHALTLDPKFAPALAYLGLVHREQGRSQEAVEFYERALTLDEKLPVVHYLAADALLRETTPDSRKVEMHLRRAIDLDPSIASSMLALGKLYFRENRLDEALKLLERAVALDPKVAEPHYQLGRLYIRLKRQTEGQAELEKFKQLSEGQKEQEQNQRRDIVHRLAKVRF
ncbi:MAG: tetratricopeptide repeat protein [Pyrinomonadaceae bacterium]